MWTLTVIARFDEAGSNCLSFEHERGVWQAQCKEREDTVEEEGSEGTVQWKKRRQ